MKTILVATDFSKAAHNACVYSAALASAFNARLILFNAYQQVPLPPTQMPDAGTWDDMDEQVKQALETTAHIINRGGVIPIETVCMEGPVTDSILRAAHEYNADIVVTGMKQDGKGFRKIWGSTVTALARKAVVPLIVVPEETKYSRWDNIALGNESDIEQGADGRSLETFREMAEKFHSRLYLVRIAQSRYREAYEASNHPYRLVGMLRELDPVYECIEGKDIPQALNEFIAGYRIDMLALLPHKYSLLERWFINSTTRSMIFKTHIPLLILPELNAAESIHEDACAGVL